MLTAARCRETSSSRKRRPAATNSQPSTRASCASAAKIDTDARADPLLASASATCSANRRVHLCSARAPHRLGRKQGVALAAHLMEGDTRRGGTPLPAGALHSVCGRPSCSTLLRICLAPATAPAMDGRDLAANNRSASRSTRGGSGGVTQPSGIMHVQWHAASPVWVGTELPTSYSCFADSAATSRFSVSHPNSLAPS